MMRNAAALTLALVALSNLSTAAAAEWIVDSRGSGDFRSIQPAIDAAVAGDRILVKPGYYDGFNVDKGVAVISTAFSRAVLQDVDINISQVPAGQIFRMEGFTFGARNPSAILVDRCLGQVVLADFDYPNFLLGATLTKPIIDVQHSVDVLITRINTLFLHMADPNGAMASIRVQDSIVDLVSSVIVGFSGDEGKAGGTALLVKGDSSVKVAGTILEGGHGGDADWYGGGAGAGAPGAILENGDFDMVGSPGRPSEIRGGRGGWGIGDEGGQGGTGLVVAPLANASLSRTTVDGGEGGDGTPVGQNGAAIDGTVGYPQPAHPIGTFTGRCYVGGAINHLIIGEAGAFGFDLWGLGSVAAEVPSIDGLLRIDPSKLLAAIPFTLSNTGGALLGGSIPNDPAFIGLTIQAQSFIDPDGAGPAPHVFTNLDAVVINP